MILLDPPRWPAHGTRFSHLVSDRSLEELHAFARAVGLSERAFEGDHYDVPEQRYASCVAAGAVPVSGTELARALRDSGLRFRKRRGERPLARVEDGLAPFVTAPHLLDVVASGVERREAGSAVVVVRAESRVLLVRSGAREGWAPPGGKREPGEGLRAGAVREVAEESGIVLAEAALEVVGYERVAVRGGGDPGPFALGDNYIQVYAVRLAEVVAVAPVEADVVEAAWFGAAEVEHRCSALPWWPLVERVLADGR